MKTYVCKESCKCWIYASLTGNPPIIVEREFETLFETNPKDKESNVAWMEVDSDFPELVLGIDLAPYAEPVEIKIELITTKKNEK